MIRERRAGFIARVSLSSFLLLCPFLAAAAQSPSNGGDSAPAAAQAQPSKPHHVITNEDIDAEHARSSGGQKSAGVIPGTGDCDAECAEQARQMLGIGPGREGEWRIQLAAARRGLAEDKEWPGALAEAARAVRNYCGFHSELRTAVLPTGEDWAARVERAKRQKYVEDMDRALGQYIANTSARINRLIQQAGNDNPVRAAIMWVLASRVTDSCPDDP